MSAQGEDLLAWLDRAITAREDAARAAHDTDPSPWSADTRWDQATYSHPSAAGSGFLVAANGVGLWDCEGASVLCMTASASLHIALNDPAAVLRRCAADRKLLALHRPDSGGCTVCAGEEQYDEDSEGEVSWSRSALPDPCPTVRAIAEGYGWADPKNSRPDHGAQTSPIEGDQMT